MQILVLIDLYFLKCSKFDQLILRKIIKIVATRCQILTLKCTKIDFGWGSVPNPAEELTALAQTPWLDLMGPTSKGRGGRGGGARLVCLLVLTILATGLKLFINLRFQNLLKTATDCCRAELQIPRMHTARVAKQCLHANYLEMIQKKKMAT